MNTNLLIFFAIPLAVIIFSIALQKVLRNPFLVAGIIFSILLIIVLAFFDIIYLIAVLVYTILSFITAVLTWLICRWLRNNQICDIICDNNSSNQVIDVSNNINGGGENINYNYSCNNAIEDTTNGFTGITGSYTKNFNRRR